MGLEALDTLDDFIANTVDTVVVNTNGEVTEGKYNCMDAGEQLTVSIQTLQEATIVMDRRFCSEKTADKRDMIDDFGEKMTGDELKEAQDASVQGCLNHITTLFTLSAKAITNTNNFLRKFKSFGLIGKIINVVTKVVDKIVKAIKKVRTTYKNAVDTINPKMQKVCQFGNKLRKPLGTVFRALDKFNCGIKKYGYCGCPNFMVNTIMRPTTIIDTWADELRRWTSVLQGDQNDPPNSIIDQIYNVVCNPTDPLVAAWEEIKGIIWDIIYGEICCTLSFSLSSLFFPSFSVSVTNKHAHAHPTSHLLQRLRLRGRHRTDSRPHGHEILYRPLGHGSLHIDQWDS